AERLRVMPMSSEMRVQLDGRSAGLVNMKIPDSVSGETRTAIQQAIRESFVAGFRRVAYVAAGLALMSALSSWLLIEGKAKPASERVKAFDEG
ncbi:MAG: MFS transporter, partial [Pyrinomonadaceae bacterium]